MPVDPDERLLPCDVILPPALTIRAGCNLSTLIHMLELRGMPHPIRASGMEAGTGETEGLDPKDDSAVPEGQTSKPSPNPSSSGTDNGR